MTTYYPARASGPGGPPNQLETMIMKAEKTFYVHHLEVPMDWEWHTVMSLEEAAKLITESDMSMYANTLPEAKAVSNR